MKILFCGARDYKRGDVVRRVMLLLLKKYKDYVVIHGDAKGADRLAGFYGKEFDLEVQVFPANWEKHGKSAGPIRNRQMLDQNPDMVVAFHPFIRNSKGTKDCVMEARRRGIEVRIFK